MAEKNEKIRKELLEKVKKEIETNMSEDEKNEIVSGIYSGMITGLLKRLIKFEGYSVANTILKREMREQGIHDAKMIKKLFKLGDTKEDASKVLKIATLLIGYNLDVRENETVIKNCPFAKVAIEANNRTFCSVCSDYINGLSEGVLGDDYYMEGTHDITKDEPVCYFELRKK